MENRPAEKYMAINALSLLPINGTKILCKIALKQRKLLQKTVTLKNLLKPDCL